MFFLVYFVVVAHEYFPTSAPLSQQGDKDRIGHDKVLAGKSSWSRVLWLGLGQGMVHDVQKAGVVKNERQETG